MLDFKTELEKLKSGVARDLIKPFDFADYSENNKYLSELNSKLDNISLQNEEIYDMLENNSSDNILFNAVMNICDLLDIYINSEEYDDAGRRKLREILAQAEINMLGVPGEKLKPEIHRAVSAEIADGIMPEQVLKIIQPGYSYKNKVLRKAKVVVSK